MQLGQNVQPIIAEGGHTEAGIRTLGHNWHATIATIGTHLNKMRESRVPKQKENGLVMSPPMQVGHLRCL